MATAIPYAETEKAPARSRVTLSGVIGTLVFAAAVFAFALVLIA